MKKISAFSIGEFFAVIFIIVAISYGSYYANNRPSEVSKTESTLKETYDLINSIVIAENNKKNMEQWGWDVENIGEASNKILNEYILKNLDKHTLCSSNPLLCVGGYSSMSGEEHTNFRENKDFARAIIANGVHIALKSQNKCKKNQPSSLCGVLLVDINNKEGSNILGKDVFVFGFYGNGSFLPYGLNLNANKIEAGCNEESYGDMCAAKIMRDNWHIKYGFKNIGIKYN